MDMRIQHWPLNRADVQLITQVHRAKNVLKDMVVHIRWLEFTWVNVYHAESYVTIDQIDVTEKLANASYVSHEHWIIWLLFYLFRIVKAIAKVIDVSDVDLVLFSMHVSINVFEKDNINHVRKNDLNFVKTLHLF